MKKAGIRKYILSVGLSIGIMSLSPILPTLLPNTNIKVLNDLTNTVSLKADIITDKIGLVRKISNEQNLIVNAIEIYIELFGSSPTSITDLKTSGLLDNGFSFTYSTSFTVGINYVTLTTNYGTTPATYQSDFYVNNFSRSRVVQPSVSGTNFITKYYLGKEAMNTKSYVGLATYISPTPPSSTTTGHSWYDTKKKKLMYYYSGWKTLDTKKLWIVKSIAELPSNATENDAGVVLTTTSLDKYLYIASSWQKIDTIPFNYNTGF